MSKKKFTTGLESLFGEPQEQERHVSTVTETALDADDRPLEQSPIRRNSSKNFTSDLDSLFRDAFTEAIEDKAEKLKKSAGYGDDLYDAARSLYKKPLSGLDALIRQTVDTSLAGMEHAAIKRITFTFENQKIEKLKSIAKMERAFLKDVVNGVITEFIDNYEKRTGRLV